MTEPLPKDLLTQRLDEWYRGVSIDLTGDLLDARRQAIEAMGRNLTIKSACSVVAYAHGRPEFGPLLIEWITKHGKAFDSDFAPKPTNREPRVMAACAIAHRLATDPVAQVSTVHSLLIHSAAFRGYRTSARSQNLPAIASRQLAVAAERASELPKPATTSAVEKLNKTFADLGDPPQSGAASGLEGWLQALKAATETLATRHDTVKRELVRVTSIAHQGLDGVAWLLDDYCELADRPWAETKGAAAVLAGAELAAITRTPSLPQARAMVRSMLLKAERNPDQDVKPISAVQRAAGSLALWPGGHGHVLLPLSAAIDAWREKEGASGWRELAKKRRGGGELAEKTEGEVADQAFREFLIARSLEDG
ncbi:MAG TPA: hypothetical protein VFJ76_00750 [Solirubrobacterales bacterium]|nr:hypothetical protein [Solirubrobacterales bacterium]